MELVAINTSQNVTIDYEPAGLGNRLLAVLLDLVFKVSYVVTLLIIFSFFVNIFKFDDQLVIGIIAILFFLPLLFYDFLFETFMHGQTFGKKIIKIKVVKLDGTQPSVGSYLLRWLIGLFEFSIGQGLIALISIAVSKNSQRLGDMAAGTTVIRIKPTVSLKDTILLQKKHAEYTIVFPQVSMLSDADMQLVKDVNQFYKETQNDDSLIKLSQKIKAKTGIVTELDDEAFITTLLKDYNHYQLEK